jgi:hypothetical protein
MFGSADNIMCIILLVGLGTTAVHIIDKYIKKNVEHSLEESLQHMERGECPVCHAWHPEAALHSGANNFWTEFHCPECGYTVTAHVKHNHPDDEDV